MDEFSVDGPMNRRQRHGDAAARCWALARTCAMGVTLAIVCQTAMAQAMYRIKPLGLLGGCTSPGPIAYAIAAADQVTGVTCNANGDEHAYLWKPDGTAMVDLGPDEVGTSSVGLHISASGLVAGYAQDNTGEFAFESLGNGAPMTRIYDELGGTSIFPTDVNDLGQLTGYATINATIERAFLWKNDGSPMANLGNLGGDNSVGLAINASGQLAGQSDILGDVFHHAFFLKNDNTSMQDLGTLGGDSSAAYWINDSGQVAGYSALPGTNHANHSHAFFWKNNGKPMQDLGTLGGAYSAPSAFNNSGQIAGTSATHAGKNPHAFVWLNNGTPMKDLGALGGTASYANDMNSSGQVTGQAVLAGKAGRRAFLWRNDGTKMQDLNLLIDPADPLKPFITLTGGNLINDSGDIVAEGTDSRTGHDFTYVLLGTVLTLTPRSLAFGNQPIHTSSAAKSVTVTNTSPKAMAISSIVLTGSAAGQFVFSDNCGKSMAAHASCTIKVTFKPSTKGAKSETLNVNGGGSGLRAVTLAGTGT